MNKKMKFKYNHRSFEHNQNEDRKYKNLRNGKFIIRCNLYNKKRITSSKIKENSVRDQKTKQE